MEETEMHNKVLKIMHEHSIKDDNDERFFLEVILTNNKKVKGLWNGYQQPNITEGSVGIKVITAKQRLIISNDEIKDLRYISPFDLVKYLK